MNYSQEFEKVIAAAFFGWTNIQGQIRFQRRGIRFHRSVGVFLDSSAGEESACNEGDLGYIPGLGRSPGEGKGYPLQYSGLENSMECIIHGVAKSRTRISDFHFLNGRSRVRVRDASNLESTIAPDEWMLTPIWRSAAVGSGKWGFQDVSSLQPRWKMGHRKEDGPVHHSVMLVMLWWSDSVSWPKGSFDFFFFLYDGSSNSCL